MDDSRWRVRSGHSRFEVMGTYKDVLRVLLLDGSDDSSSNHSLLPRFGQVEVEDAISSAVVYVRFHLRVAVLSADVHLVCSIEKHVRSAIVNDFAFLSRSKAQRTSRRSNGDGLTSAAIMLTMSSSLLFVYKSDILYNFFFLQKRYPSYF